MSLLFAATGLFHAGPAFAASFEAWTGGPLPAFALSTLEGQRAALADLSGKTVLVHFFATWCAPCRTELPALSRFFAVRRQDGSLAVLAIAVADAEPAVRRFLDSRPVTFPVLLDPGRALARAWSIDALPSTVIFDPALRPVAVANGNVDWDDPAVTQFLLSIAAKVPRPTEEKE